MTILLEIDELTVSFRTLRGDVIAVDRFSLSVGKGETVAIVGESGCGKSTTALSVLRLIPDPPGRISGGAIRFDGVDLMQLGNREMRRLRGDRISMIFQDAMMALNPVHTIGRQITEILRLHKGLPVVAARSCALDLLQLVGIPAAEDRLRQYPHNLSGGMRQRVMIAIALACNPQLVIADEPTTAVDVTVQAQILRLIASLQRRLGMAMLLITHDLGIVAETADRVVVMYAGRKVEEGRVVDVLTAPRHPYTLGLLAAARYDSVAGRRLHEIPGSVPEPHEVVTGCRFASRCSRAIDQCRMEEPSTVKFSNGQSAACIRAAE